MDAIVYSKYNSLQNKDTIDFLVKSSSILDWGNLINEVVMDLGCGPGNTSSKYIVSLFPPIRRVVALDKSESMIELAKVLNPNPKIEYWVADIMEKETLDCWEDSMDKVISTWTFQYLEDQELAFRNVYGLLKQGGEAAVFFDTNSPYYDCCRRLLNSPRWKELLQDEILTSKSIRQILHSQCGQVEKFFHRKMLESIGFVEVLCKEEYKSFTFSSEEEFRGFVEAANPFGSLLQCDLKEEFNEELSQDLMKCCGRTVNGLFTINYTTMSILAKKPSENKIQEKDLLLF